MNLAFFTFLLSLSFLCLDFLILSLFLYIGQSFPLNKFAKFSNLIIFGIRFDSNAQQHKTSFFHCASFYATPQQQHNIHILDKRFKQKPSPATSHRHHSQKKKKIIHALLCCFKAHQINIHFQIRMTSLANFNLHANFIFNRAIPK